MPVTQTETVSFDDLAKPLYDKTQGKVDLRAELKETIARHKRWGYDGAVAGTEGSGIDSADQYEKLFEEIEVKTEPVQLALKVRALVDFGIKPLSIINPGQLLPEAQWKKLFEEAGLPYWEGIYGLENLGKVRSVDPADFEAVGVDLRTLHEESREEQIAAFEKVYENALPIKPTGASVTFTAGGLEVPKTSTNTSAIDDMQSGVSMLDMGDNLLRMRIQIDAGLRAIAKEKDVDFDSFDVAGYQDFMKQCFEDKSLDPYLPDKQRITRMSRLVYPNGGVAAVYWDPNDRKFCLRCFLPDRAYDDLGDRPALG